MQINVFSLRNYVYFFQMRRMKNANLMDVQLLSPYIRTANMKNQTKIAMKAKQGTIVLTNIILNGSG